MKNKEPKIIYYSDELNDEFSSAKITAKEIGDDYVYVHTSFFKKITHFFWYRIIALPIATVYLKLSFHHTIKNRSVLKPYKKTGYFLFGNHTQDIADALIPTLTVFPKRAYVIVHPNNVSMPFLGRVTPSMGALPLPDTKKASRNFLHAIDQRYSENNCIMIYPEAHIWPYYTKIRPFSEDSFYYPLKHNAPVFCFTNTYQKRRFSKKPKIVTYVDGPFFPSSDASARAARKQLRDAVYGCMTERAKNSSVEYIQYKKKDKT